MELTLMYTRFLEKVIDQGFKLPIYTITVGNNGWIGAGQYDLSPIGESLNFTELTKYAPSEMVKLPINIILIDSTGQAARCLIQKPDEEPEIKILN